MPHLHNIVTGWTDLDDHSRFRNAIPTTIITADEIANGEYDGLLGDVFKGEVNRRVVYVDESGNRQYLELTLYIHPVGAGAMTIRSAGVSTCRGRLVSELGDYTATKPLLNKTIAGGLLSQYSETSSEIGSSTVREPVWLDTINEGDALWIVRRGRYLALGDGAITIDTAVVADDSGASSGGVEDAAAMAGPTAGQILENLGGPHGNKVGVSVEALNNTVTGYAYIDLDLPRRFGAP